MNTLKAYRHLIAQGFTEEEAEGQLDVLDDVLANLVTKDDLKTALSEFKVDMLKWTLGLSIGQFTIMLGLVYSMINLLKKII